MTSKAELHCIDLMREGHIRLTENGEVQVFHRGNKRWFIKKQVTNPTTGRARYKFCDRRSHIPAARLHYILKHQTLIPLGSVVDHKDLEKTNDHHDNLQLMDKTASDSQGTNKAQDNLVAKLCRWFQFVGLHGREPVTENERLLVEMGF